MASLVSPVRAIAIKRRKVGEPFTKRRAATIASRQGKEERWNLGTLRRTGLGTRPSTAGTSARC
jgi:hypothetical protein